VSTLVSKSKVGTVSNWRVLRSTTTLSYRDGNVGRGFTTVADDAMAAASQLLLSMDPDLLAIKVGSGEFRHLFVCQYVREEPTPTNDALPAQLDNPALPPAAAGEDPGVEEGLEGEDLNVMGEDAGASDGKHDPAPTAEAELAKAMADDCTFFGFAASGAASELV
jgi:hypothetical protein